MPQQLKDKFISEVRSKIITRAITEEKLAMPKSRDMILKWTFQLYDGGGLEKIISLIGESRKRNFIKENPDFTICKRINGIIF